MIDPLTVCIAFYQQTCVRLLSRDYYRELEYHFFKRGLRLSFFLFTWLSPGHRVFQFTSQSVYLLLDMCNARIKQLSINANRYIKDLLKWSSDNASSLG